MRKILQSLVLILVFVLTVSAYCFSGETIRLEVGEYPPYLSKELKCNGYVAHVVSESFALEGINIETIFCPWKRAIAEAKRGHVDGTFLWVLKPDRKKNFYVSEPLAEGKVVFFHLKEYSFDWNAVEDLVGIHIGATLEYIYGEAFDAAEKAGKINVDRAWEDIVNFKMLLKKRIDIFPINQDVGYHLLRTKFSPEQAELVTHHPKPIKSSTYYALFTKNNDKSRRLVNLFDKGLNCLKKSGKYNQIVAESQKGGYLK